MATISFDLVSPESLIFNDEVGMIILPGKDGDLGVLPGHSKVMSSLRPGRVMVYGEDKNLLKSFFVSGGFAEINNDEVMFLVESIEKSSEIDLDRAKSSLSRAEIRKSKRPSNFDYVRNEASLYRAINRLKVSKR